MRPSKTSTADRAYSGAPTIDDDRTLGVGERIANARKARSFSQRQLAEHAHVSLSLLRKVEQGSRDATPALIAAVAWTLTIDVTALTGQPYDLGGRHLDPLHQHIPALRRALTYWDLPPEGITPRPPAELVRDADHAADLRRSGSHVQLATNLPALLTETTAAIHSAPAGPERERSYAALTVLLFAARSVTYKTGYIDLSTLIEERTHWAALASSDPMLGARSDGLRGGDMAGRAYGARWGWLIRRRQRRRIQRWFRRFGAVLSGRGGVFAGRWPASRVAEGNRRTRYNRIAVRILVRQVHKSRHVRTPVDLDQPGFIFFGGEWAVGPLPGQLPGEDWWLVPRVKHLPVIFLAAWAFGEGALSRYM